MTKARRLSSAVTRMNVSYVTNAQRQRCEAREAYGGRGQRTGSIEIAGKKYCKLHART